MSLRVWLPLIADVHNQGVSGITLTNTGATFVSGGKIGNAVQFGTAKSYLKMNSVAPLTAMTECSVSLWIKILTWNTNYATYFQLGLGNTPWAHYIFGLLRNNAASTLCFTISNGSSATNANCLTPELALNTWYHLTLTYSTGHCKIYVNGMQTRDFSTTIVPNFAGITTGIIGACNDGNNYQTNCLINDFRIYDECLSAATIHEIAQGLVLHYKLDGELFGNSNLLLNTHFDNRYNQTTGWDTAKNGTLLASNWGGYNSGVANQATCYHAHLKLFNNEYVYEYIKDTETWLGISQGGLQSKLIAGKTYTFSCEQYSITNTNYMYGGLYYYKTNATSASFHLGYIYCNTNRQQNTWQKFTYTFTAPSDGDYSKNMSWYCYGHTGGAGTFYLRHLKLEEGNAATPWCPADSEMNIDRTIIEDSSGYNHNGEILNGPLSLTSDASRYNISTHFSATNQKIKISNFPTSGFGNSYTFAWWAKISSATPMHWGFSDGIRLNGMYTGRLWNTGDSSNNPLYTPGTTTQVTAPTVNVWHHWAMTGDGTKCCVYQDGVLWAEAKTYKAISGTTIYINGWDNGTSYSSDNYSISDFRIYCTPLLDTDIKSLYNVGMKIDKNANMHSFELEETVGMVPNAKFVNNSATSVSYDEATDTYTIVSPANTSSWGYGVRLADTPALWVPYGATYRWTAEVWTPIALSVNTDYNNTTGSADTNWAGNDNDATGTRLAAGVAIPANTWTRIYRGASNTNSGNTNHLPIRDYSSLGLVTNGQSDPVTWKVRHLQWYIADTGFKPQIKRTGVFEASHFTEVEEDLNKPAQINKKMFSVNATQFIER